MSDSNNGKKPHVVVLGGGPGGYPAAFLAADLGFEVTLIDKNGAPGGVCLYVGCIPSKTLLHAAKLMHEVAEAEDMGISFGKPEINLDTLRGYKDKVVKKLTGGLGVMAKQRGIAFVRGTGAFTGPNEITVTDEGGATSTVAFDYCIIATGSTPAMVPAWDIGSDRVMDSTAALKLEDVPERLLVIGGGYIGLEMGTVYQALGSKVSVVEAMGSLLPAADQDLVQHLRKSLDGRFEQIMLNTKVTELREEKDGIHVKLLGLDVEEKEQVFDKVLVSIGRRPRSKGIGLENTGVEVDDRGWIKSDNQRRTAQENIFVIGDVAGEPMLAHKATYEARIAVETIAGKPTEFDAQAIPAVVFTDPELAWAGITENEAKEDGIHVKVSRFPWAASGRATTIDRNDGLTKFIVDPQTDRVLGVGIVGVGAGELIAEATLAIELGARASDIARTIHAHPTLSETVMETADMYFGHSAHYIERKK